MAKVKVEALVTINSSPPGTVIELDATEARELMGQGVVRKPEVKKPKTKTQEPEPTEAQSNDG